MIKVLDKSIADKIAAGEVIERPLSIVKELVENSVDAGATTITCEIKNGGKSFIRVTDNGSGIPYDDTEIAFLRHATSKIDKVSDLYRITSLGFRGEALASIAAVSHTALITKTADSKTGTRVTIHGGEVIQREHIGCPDGTSMVVTDLFYNTPARREFMKSDHAESSVIIEFMSEMAICYTNIRFQLINNGKMVFTSRGDGKLKNAILSVYKQKEYRDLIEVDYHRDGYHLVGCISRPSLSRATRRDQIFFVNGRSVKSKVMEKGLSRGYKERLFEGRYPVVFLFLTVEPETIDVNIHPNKKEIRFHDDRAIITHIEEAVSQVLASDSAVIEASDSHIDYAGKTMPAKASFVSDQTLEEQKKSEQVDLKNILSNMRKSEAPKFVPDAAELEKKWAAATQPLANEEPSKPAERIGIAQKPESSRPSEGLFKSNPVSSKSDDTPWETASLAQQDPVLTGRPKEEDKPAQVAEPEREVLFREEEPVQVPKPLITIEEPRNKPFEIRDLTVTGNIFNTYVTATDQKAFYLLDQHAAQERIFYEKLVGEYLADDKPSQTILTPIMLEVSLAVKENEYSWIQSLRDMGFHIEEFGPNTYIIKEIPYFMEISEAETFAKDYVDQIRVRDDLSNTVVINKLITTSCKRSVKAHDKLSLQEMKALLEDLARCRNPFSCPHGRPTIIRFSEYEIEKMFKRIQ